MAQSNVTEVPFFDPAYAEFQRQLAYKNANSIDDLTLSKGRMLEDQSLFRPYMLRRFGRQGELVASDVAGRGFSGARQGVMQKALSNLAGEQSYTLAQYDRRNTRGMEDIERAIARLTEQGIISSGEAARGAAGSASQRAQPRYITP